MGKLVDIIYFGLVVLLAVGANPVAAGQNQWTSTGPTTAVHALAAGSTGLAYAGGSDGIFHSLDAGATWQALAAGVMPGPVLSLAVDPHDPRRIFAGTSAGLYTSADGGGVWTANGPRAGVLSLAIAASGAVYAATFGRGVAVSLDGGRVWGEGSGALADAIVFSLATSPWNDAVVYAGTGQGLYLSRDQGNNWQALGEGLAAYSVRRIYPSRGDPNVLLIATFGGGVLRSDDGGVTWSQRNSGLADLNVRDLGVDRRDENKLYAATAAGFYRSLDGGKQWETFNEGLDQTKASALLIDAKDPDRLLGAGGSQGVWRYRLDAQAQLRLSAEGLDFGRVPVGTEARLAVSLENAGAVSLDITALTLDGGSDFSLEEGVVSVAAGNSARLVFSFRPQAPGSAQTTFTLQTNIGPAQIVLSGVGVQAQLTVLPDRLQLGQVRLGAVLDTTILLYNGGNEPLELRNAYFEEASFRVLNFVSGTLLPGQEQRLKLRFSPQAPRGLVAPLVLLSDVPGQERIEVFVDGEGTAPDIAAAPRQLDFGSVDVGQSRPLSIAVSNGGNTALIITDLRLGTSHFRADLPEPILLEPGQVHPFEVRFVPSAGGTYNDTLVIVNDAPGRLSVFEIVLVGQGGALALESAPGLALDGEPGALIMVDVDRDGMLDLAMADGQSGLVTVLRNDGAGGFHPALGAVYPGQLDTYLSWDQPVALAAAPLGGKGPDLLVGDKVGRLVSVLSNNGAGGFSTGRRDYFIGHGLEAIHAADLDADGDFDVAVAGTDAGLLTLLFNNGSGNFNGRSLETVGAEPVALASAHLNGDPRRDLVVANRGGHTVSVLLSVPGGGYHRRDYAAGNSPIAVSPLDFDADGDTDIVVANQQSRDITLLLNQGDGQFVQGDPVPVDLAPTAMGLSEMTADIFGDLVLVGPQAPYLQFLENEGGTQFLAKEILRPITAPRALALGDLDADGDNDLAVLEEAPARLQVYFNRGTRQLDAPRPPTEVTARDLARDLGRRIEIGWNAPELDEQLGRTVEYILFRALAPTGPFSEVGRVAAGFRNFVDQGATFGQLFYYYVVAAGPGVESAPSAIVSAASAPSPFFELELAAGTHLSVGDTLKVGAYLTPAGYLLEGASLYLSFDDSALVLLDADTTLTEVLPFRPNRALASMMVLENRLDGLSSKTLNLSLSGLSLEAGVEPVLLGEFWFLAAKDTVSVIHIDDLPRENRRSALLERGTGRVLLPFIRPEGIRLEVQDFRLAGNLQLEGGQGGGQPTQVTLSLIDGLGQLLESPINDLDSGIEGIQTQLDGAGSFRLGQIPAGRYQVYAKTANHLQGQALGDTVAVGDSLYQQLSFHWIKNDTISTPVLGAGDANGDNQVNLADLGLVVHHFGQTQAQIEEWAQARFADFNGDGVVGSRDFIMLVQNFGEVGMAPAVASRVARQGWWQWERGKGQLSVGDVGPLTGFAVYFAGEPPPLAPVGARVWQKGNGWWLAATAVGEANARAQVLLDLGDGIGVAEPLVVEVLGGDGRVSRPVRRSGQPVEFGLGANFPNPFNPSTSIPFTLGKGAGVVLSIYDVLGQKLRVLLDEKLESGTYEAVWNGRDTQGRPVGSGVYFYRLEVGDKVFNRRLLLLR